MPIAVRNFGLALRFIALILVLLPATNAWPAELRSVGTRVSQGGDAENFNQYDLIADVSLPWSWSGEQWRFETLLATSIGMLKYRGDEGAIVSLGPALEMWPGDSNWRFMIGMRPTLMSKDRYGGKDLGGNFHFTSFIGARYQFSEKWALGYQMSHMSNAGLNDPNPGLNLHSLVLSRSF